MVGRDSCFYPYTFNIADSEPRAGRFHLPSPAHQTFEGDGFVVGSFCPRPQDFDPQAVAVPYVHSNVMVDEVLYYPNAGSTSRQGIEPGSITLHPQGIPHGPPPGREATSINQTATTEVAIMLDAFHPLRVAIPALAIEDRAYYRLEAA